jgi:signal peptidase II
MTDSMFKRKKYFRLLVVAGVLVLLDQATKLLVFNTMPLYDVIPIVPGFFNIVHVHNPGGAFGFMANHSVFWRQVVFLFISGGAVFLILYFYHKTPDTHMFLSVAFAMIFGGAVGNMIDRLRLGIVVDFLDFYVGGLHWPAFNVADSAITVGIGIFVYHLVFKKIPENM